MYWSRSFLLFLVEQQISGGAGGDVSRRIVCLCALSVRCLCRLYVNNNRNKRREGNKKKMTRSEECKAVMWPQEHTVQSYWPLYLNTLNGLSIRGKGREKKEERKEDLVTVLHSEKTVNCLVTSVCQWVSASRNTNKLIFSGRLLL